MIMIIILILIVIVIAILLYMDPKVDYIIINNEKLKIIWYNCLKERKYIIINKLL